MAQPATPQHERGPASRSGLSGPNVLSRQRRALHHRGAPQLERQALVSMRSSTSNRSTVHRPPCMSDRCRRDICRESHPWPRNLARAVAQGPWGSSSRHRPLVCLGASRARQRPVDELFEAPYKTSEARVPGCASVPLATGRRPAVLHADETPAHPKDAQSGPRHLRDEVRAVRHRIAGWPPARIRPLDLAPRSGIRTDAG